MLHRGRHAENYAPKSDPAPTPPFRPKLEVRELVTLPALRSLSSQPQKTERREGTQWEQTKFVCGEKGLEFFTRNRSLVRVLAIVHSTRIGCRAPATLHVLVAL